jgi:dienelactone hydrolase
MNHIGKIKNKLENYRHLFYAVVFLEFLFISDAPGQTLLMDSIMNGNNFEKAAFSLWIKSGITKIHGLIVLIPGSNYDGRTMVNDAAWQNLAKRYDLALLGCYYKDKVHENMDIENYADVKNGSGQAMIDILRTFSIRSGHLELANAPLALWGISAGGEFNYEFVCWKPERVIAFIVNKGGIYYSSLAPTAAWDVPGIFFTGEKDSPFRNNIIKGIFSINRRFNAKWILAEEPGAAHEFKKSEIFARFFFDKIIPLRLSGNTVNAPDSVQKITAKGYVGVNATQQISRDSDNKQVEITSWFPNREIAEEWLNLIK